MKYQVIIMEFWEMRDINIHENPELLEEKWKSIT